MKVPLSDTTTSTETLVPEEISSAARMSEMARSWIGCRFTAMTTVFEVVIVILSVTVRVTAKILDWLPFGFTQPPIHFPNTWCWTGFEPESVPAGSWKSQKKLLIPAFGLGSELAEALKGTGSPWKGNRGAHVKSTMVSMPFP